MNLDLSLFELTELYPDEESAIAFFESARWPDGRECPSCESSEIVRVNTSRRLPLHSCQGCEYQFTVTSGTVMEHTMLPLRKWLLAYYIIGGAKKGVSARYLARALSITPKSAWHLGHRIRATMIENTQVFDGVVESDETYVGGRRRNRGRGYRGNKIAVQTIVERNKADGTPGQAQTIALGPAASSVDGRTVGAKLRAHTIEEATVLMTDESPIYSRVGEDFVAHHTVNHKKKEYVREEDDGTLAHTNTAEGLFANLKRQIIGTHHHVSKKHMPRYLEEYDYKYNTRGQTDGERTLAAIQRMVGKRVTLYRSGNHDSLFDRVKPEKAMTAKEKERLQDCVDTVNLPTGKERRRKLDRCLVEGPKLTEED